jgi:excisionase family DNA binding protein
VLAVGLADPTRRVWQAGEVTDQHAPQSLDVIVPAWLSIPQVAELLGISPNAVRQLVREGRLVAIRHEGVREPQIPADFLLGGEPVKGLAGALTVLADSGFGPEETVRWLFTEDDTLPGSPIQALRESRGTEVRRRAQALAF